MGLAVLPDDPDFPNNPWHGELAQARFWHSVKPHVRKFRCAIDVGAHIGIWTRMLARDFKMVDAFEPNPDTFACLELNTAHLKHVRRHSIALGAITEFCDIVPHGGNSGCYRVDPQGMDVKMNRLDSFDFKELDLLKIDVEGYEGEVIEGARGLIIAKGPTIVFEDNGLGEKLYGKEWLDPKPILRHLGYEPRLRVNKDEVWVPR